MARSLSTEAAVRTLLLLMPRLVGRAKRLPMPEALRSLSLAPRHLALLANVQYDGSLTVGELARRLELAPTTVSLMVTQLSDQGVLVVRQDETDRRLRRVEIASSMSGPIGQWLDGTSRAWAAALDGLTGGQRATVVGALQAYEDALDAELD